MPLPITNFKNFLRAAGLTREGGLGGWGMRRGFPISFRFAGTDMSGDAVARARLAPGAPPALTGDFAPPLDAFLRSGEAAVGIDEQFATLILRGAKKRFSNGEVLPALDAFLAGIEASGARPQSACGSCGATENLTVLSNGVDAGMICPSCVSKQASAYADRHGYVAESLPKLLALGVATLLGVAVVWAGVAIGIDKIFEAAGGSIKTSGKLMVLLAMLFGGVIGLPGALFKLVPRRGKWPPILLALGAGLLGVALGEILHTDWLLSARSGAVVMFPPLELVWRLATDGNGFLIFLRALMAGTAVLTAVALAKPPKPSLAL